MKKSTEKIIKYHSDRIKKLEIDKIKYENLLINGSFFRRNNYGGLVADLILNIRYHTYAMAEIVGVDDGIIKPGFNQE